MITKITTENANKYRALFAKATQDLRTHNYDPGQEEQVMIEVPYGAGLIAGGTHYEDITVTEVDYVAGEMAIWDESSETWRLTNIGDPYIPGARYGIAITDGEITSLEEYFQFIADLKNINPIYTILPVDEELFEINANTRAITVPAEFAKNGVSVQSDEISEILYFRVDRFYDMEDLTNADIFIEWRCPVNADGERKEGVSKPWAIDVESDPGHVIFGWPLASEITELPGQVEFSVRFYRYDENTRTVEYSLSTLTNTVVIKPSIDLKNTVRQNLETPGAITDSTILLDERIINSDDSAAGTLPDHPSFGVLESEMENSTKDIVIRSKEDNSYQFYTYVPADPNGGKKFDEYLVYLTNPTTGDEYEGLYRIRSRVNDTGMLNYTWIKMNDENVILNAADFENSMVFLPTEDTSFVANRVYYTRTGEAPDYVYTPFVGEHEADADPSNFEINEEAVVLYEKWGQATLQEAQPDGSIDFVIGTYQPRITNRLGRRTERVYGPIVRVQPPIQPVITRGVPASAILGETEDTLEGEVVAPLTIEASVDAHGYTKFTWYKQDDEEWVAIGETVVDTREADPDDAAKSNVESVAFDIPGTTYEATAEDADNGDGYYKVVVSTLLNSQVKIDTAAEANEEAIVRVTHAAAPAVLDQSILETERFRVNVGTKMYVGLTPNENEQRTSADYYEYQWYRYVSTEDVNVINADHDAAAAGLYIDPAKIAKDQIIEGLSGRIDDEHPLENGYLPNSTVPNTVGLDDNGLYYCIITNHYNGSTCLQSSNFIENVDTGDQH